MPINWNDNKVFNSTAQQRPAYSTKPPMTGTTAPQMDMQMNRMNDNMMGAQDMGNMAANDMMGNDMAANDMMFQQGPPPVMDKHYLAGYLASNIGKKMRAEFPLPGGFFVDKAGVLKEVGVNYFVLEDFLSKAQVICDLYSVKFVYIL